jgi:carbamoyltransferase
VSSRTASIGPRFRRLGTAAFMAMYPLARAAGALGRLHSPTGAYARERIASMRQQLERGETVYILGIGPGGHNAGVGLVEASRARGIRLIANHEEERFRAVKHCQRYPELSVRMLAEQMKQLGIAPGRIHAACTSWDYPYWTSKAIQSVVQELPGSLRLLTRDASPQMNAQCVLDAFTAPRRLGRQFGADGARMPVINLRHHDNHAWLSWGVSPFAKSDEPVLVLVVDGAGDVGAISAYVADRGSLRLLYSNDSLWDSLGMMYGILSSTQGGWPLLSSEGRYMGAAAWGDSNRLTNRYYGQLRDVFVLGSEGRIFLNRSLANWHRGGCAAPYTKRLVRIIGEPILPGGMWHPDAVLNVDNIEHAPITIDRVDKAAAVQLVFEDALFHVVQHLIRTTRSTRLVLTGGTALNCVANMRLMEQFDSAWYERNLGMRDATLHLWVPPVPGDAGVVIGAAYHFACLAGARPGASLQHAFYCGMPPTKSEIERAVATTPEIAYRVLGNVARKDECERLADLLAFIVSRDGIVGIFQGAAETGPRALGHRSILANPANTKTLERLNSLVKYRERIRPLAPMATLEAAKAWFDLLPGAGDDDYNAYNYMVLTSRAKPEAFRAIPAVIHHDGTSRVQIVREQVDPFVHAYLVAMGRRIGAEVSVNTSLNVGAPIAQTPVHALETLKRSTGMHALFMIADSGDVVLAWHDVDRGPKDGGRALRAWIAEWGCENRAGVDLRLRSPLPAFAEIRP